MCGSYNTEVNFLRTDKPGINVITEDEWMEIEESINRAICYGAVLGKEWSRMARLKWKFRMWWQRINCNCKDCQED
jgi:hypothetical protein